MQQHKFNIDLPTPPSLVKQGRSMQNPLIESRVDSVL